MPWNQPGNNDNKDPWGNRKKQDGPPDLDDIVKKIGAFFGGGKKGGGSNNSARGPSGLVYLLVIVVFVGIYTFKSFYKVDDKQRSVVTQFGKFLRIDMPGAHFVFPPFQRYRVVDVTSLNEIEVSGEMLTEDDNVVSANIKIQYRIENPKDWFFNVANPENTLVHAAESALRQVIGHSRMEDVLTGQKESIRSSVSKELISTLEPYGTGIDIVRVSLGNPELPGKVKPAYYDAVKAEEDEQRYINEAQAYSNKEIPLAEGSAERKIQEATAYQTEVVEKAKGEVARFAKLLPQYEAAPRVTRDRLYLDMMEDVMSSTTKILIDVDGGNNMMYLPLNEIINKSTRKKQ